jgi:intein/homing endonuclease
MISKLIFPDAFDFGMPTASLIPLHSRGIDDGWLHKRAAMFDTDLEFERKPGHQYIHLISVGATERYGPNNNGDAFIRKGASHTCPDPKDPSRKTIDLTGGLVEYHDKTFMKNGAVYKQHVNKHENGTPSGYIVKAAYNMPMDRGELIIGVEEDKWRNELQKVANDESIYFSMGCFTAGTLITMADGKQKAIEEVEAGDTVRMHDGSIGTVECTKTDEKVDDVLMTIKPSGGIALECTTNHPFFVVPREKLINSAHRFVGKDVDVLKEGSWKHAACLELGDYVVTPIDDTVERPEYMTTEFMRLLGYYLAEGYLLFDGKDTPVAVRFTVHKEEKAADEIPELCAALGTAKLAHINGDKNSPNVATITVRDSGLAERFWTLCGKGAKNKQLDEELLNAPKELILEMLGTYHNGDGGFYSNTGIGSKGNAYFSTASDGLAVQLQLLFAKLGAPVSINTIQHRTSRSAGVERGFTTEYQVWCSKEATALLVPYAVKLPEFIDEVRGRRDRFVVNGYMLTRVNKIDREEASFTVYNMEVASEQHSYLANGVAVHNSDCPEDICSYCHNEAHTLKEYCPHLKDHLMKIASDGTQVCALTPRPFFHDISGVGRPAEKICFGLRKVAGQVISGAELAEMYAIAPPAHMFPAGSTLSRRYNLLQKLAKIEKEVLLTNESGCGDEAFTPESGFGHVDDKVVDSMSAEDPHAALGALKRCKVVLPAELFFKLIMRDKYGEVKEDMPDVKDALPGILGRMLESPELSSILGDGSYEPTDCCSGPLMEGAKAMVPDCSLEAEPVRVRVVRAVLNGAPAKGKVTIIKKASEVSERAETLATEYANYLLSFSAGLTDTEQRLSVVQLCATV